MAELFIVVYYFFKRHRWLFVFFLALFIGLIVLFASKIRLEEDITRVNSSDSSLSRYEFVIRNFKFADKLIVHLYQADTNANANPDLLISIAGSLRDSLLSKLDSNYVRQISLQFNDSLFNTVQRTIDHHLPLFLNENDYKAIDSLMLHGNIASLLTDNFRMLVSPASMVLQQRIIKDPLGITGMAFKKFSTLQSDHHYILYNGCIFSKDKKHLVMIITPTNLSSETKKNSHLVSILKKYVAIAGSANATSIHIEYYGYAATAVGNANQIKIDIILTLCIAIILIFLLLGWYFRNILIPMLGFIPAFFGGGLALVILYLINGKISFIALGIGSVILGLIIDYALYLINHYRLKKSVEQVLKDMSHTILICSITTIGVFLCLTFLDSNVLHDLGWFASISVLGASLASLIILPQFFGKSILPKENEIGRTTFIDKIGAIDFGKKVWLLAGLAIAGAFSMLVSHKVAFEKDLNSLNYMSESLRTAEKHLEKISSSNLKDVYIVATGKNLNDALRWNEVGQKKLETLKREGKIDDFSGIGDLLFSDSIQTERLQKWNEFWTSKRKSVLINQLVNEGRRVGFNENAFSGIKSMLNASYLPITSGQNRILLDLLFSDWINETPELTMISGIAKVTDREKRSVYDAYAGTQNLVIFDRQNLTTRFVLTVKHDFELLITLSMIFITLLLLITFGRIELTILTSLPMYFSWLITLGFMGFTGIRFNIFNIIISSFIFGLGVDYSILMMRGLLSQYRSGVNDMKTYQVSILLSSATTLIGVGVLFFARHPALNSIALISIIGIISVVIISLSYQSMITRWLLLNPMKKKSYPLTARIILHSIFLPWKPLVLSNAMNIRLNYLYKGPVLEWYLRVKMALENNFDSCCRLLPQKGEILDLGCGYGYISYMLMLTSDERIITGVDYDEKKIMIAQHGYLKNERISFYNEDISEFKITPKEGFLFGDVLHYLPFDKQEALLEDCVNNLNSGGVILIREGNSDKETRHQRTRFTEFFSTRVLRFNKTQDRNGKLYFTSATKLSTFAEEHGLTFEIVDQKKITSNNFFIMRMP